ncbi:MAG: DUF1932 domain-containing protein [Candidatus Dormiibacterota bacterium]
MIGLLSPGAMGAAVGGRLVDAGETVLWASAGRGPETVARAQAAGLTDAGSIASLVAGCDLVFSVVPPQFAQETASAAVDSGFRGLYVDGNAIAPQRAAAIRAIVERGGARFVDGGIVGPPPVRPGTTRLYLSGREAPPVAARFAATAIEALTVAGGDEAASALKLAYAAWTKGSAALLLTARALARRSGVERALAEEWARSQPGLEAQLEQARRSATEKGWRWAPEMEEIAATMRDAGLPEGFHEAAAAVFRQPVQELLDETD